MERSKRLNYKAKKGSPTLRTITREISLTDTDRITYVYGKDSTTNEIQEVVNVSDDLWIEKRWLTILRYDSTHGYLHQHTRLSLAQEKEFISKEHILKEGSHPDWLTLAVEDIKTNFSLYRQAFLKRSNLDEADGR
jgi:hypothetical protein